MARTSKSPATRGKRKSRTLAFPVEFRLRIVELYLEEGYSPKLLVEQFGIVAKMIVRFSFILLISFRSTCMGNKVINSGSGQGT